MCMLLMENKEGSHHLCTKYKKFHVGKVCVPMCTIIHRGVARILEKKGQDCAQRAQKCLDRKPHPLIK